MRMVQVGCLGMGKWWVQVGLKSTDVDVVGYVDVNPDHLKVIQDEFGIAPSRCYLDLDKALAELKPDAVLIVTPPQFHEPIAVKAMEAGCHVLTEKPLADTWEACLRTVEAVRRTGRTMMVAQNYRYRPEVQTLRNALRSGRFGAPGQVLVHFSRGPHFGGFREEMPYPLIIDMSIHHYDMMRYILDADPQTLVATSWNPEWSWFRGDASSVCHIEMAPASTRTSAGAPASARTSGPEPAATLSPRGGLIHVTYHASWCTRGGATTWNGDWRIYCENGYLEMVNNKVYAQTEDEGPKEELPIEPMELTDQAYLLRAFYEAVRDGKEPETSAQDNLRSIEMVFRTVESCETGRKVTLTGGAA